MEKEQKESSEKKWLEIAEHLDLLQKDKNNGNGIVFAKDIVAFLKKGDVKNAKGIAQWDHDKVRLYPEIEDFLEKTIFDGDPDSPIKRRKRIAEKLWWKKEK